MNIADLTSYRVLLLGFGETNASLYRFLRRIYPTFSLTVADKNSNLVLPSDPHLVALRGERYLEALHDFDCIIRSPGISYTPEMRAHASRIVTGTQLFFPYIRKEKNVTIAGVTGTKGKSTTVSLLVRMAEAGGQRAHLFGNIGRQEWETCDSIRDGDLIVYEFSSYVLEDFHDRPDIAIYTSLFPDHIDWHGGYERYQNAKANMTKNQTPDDTCIYHARYEELAEIAKHSCARILTVGHPVGFHYDKAFFFNGTHRLFPTGALRIPGDHNKDNLCVVLAALESLRIPLGGAAAALTHFTGLAHRLEYVGRFGGIEFYDDASSTTPESTAAAVRTFGEKIGAIILGGFNRGYEYESLARLLTLYSGMAVILLTGARETIKASLRKNNFTGTVQDADDMEEAAACCYRYTPQGKIALLSPAAPSYDRYRNYEEKGDAFRTAVRTRAKRL
ncbi:MAG: UDP-N-acetylmuramoyl-L-alanine--D-glutamate ligase [Parcubacteria group bacterium]|nr:UDP-N-acetylmuramoyl-L-alanine--D-glutamate ligase [Parcubacteria group bacterium]